VATFSGGMKRRINIGVGLMNMPELLILDEPTVGIDPQSRRHILDTVKELNSRGMTVIYTSHYMEEVEYLCRRVGIMDQGRLIALDSIEELKKMAGEKETLEITAREVTQPVLDAIKKIPLVEGVSRRDDSICVLTCDAAGVLSGVIASLQERDIKVKSFHINEPNLESVFLRLTGNALRD
jgi:ABC-2 type transport system ATP-binding protein